MPRLVKGGKWVYGLVVIGPEREVTIPPEARREYGLRAGGEVLFLRGSQRSGGFSVSTPGQMTVPLEKRMLGRGRMSEGGQVVVPPEVGVHAANEFAACYPKHVETCWI